MKNQRATERDEIPSETRTQRAQLGIVFLDCAFLEPQARNTVMRQRLNQLRNAA
jgi:hypothetical protein